MADKLPSLIGDPGAATPNTSCSLGGSGSCLAGYYWSSTEASTSPRYSAWSQYFASGGGSIQTNVTKSLTLGVRCARALTN
jgi:hypothetical protein